MRWADLKESDQSSSAGQSRVTSPTDKYGDVTHPRYDQATADNGHMENTRPFASDDALLYNKGATSPVDLRHVLPDTLEFCMVYTA